MYLEKGKQTQITSLIKGHASKARSFPVNVTDLASIQLRLGIDITTLKKIYPTLEKIYKTAGYIATLRPIDGYIRDPATDEALRQNAELKGQTCYKRTLDQVLREGIFLSSPDYALVFRGLMAAQNVRTSYVLAIHKSYLLDPQSAEKLAVVDVSHPFCRVFTLGHRYFVDPTSPPRIMRREADLLPFVYWQEGLDSWSLGIRDTQEIMEQVRDETNRCRLLSKYESALASRLNDLLPQPTEPTATEDQPTRREDLLIRMIDRVRSLQTLTRPRMPCF
jgi:hypothetical protein